MQDLTIKEKIKKIKKTFPSNFTAKEKYDKIIKLGKKLIVLEDKYKIEANKVPNCQSITYIHSYKKNDLINFKGTSNSLISSGLLYILFQIYSNESPKTILLEPPNFIQEIKLNYILSSTRLNGIHQMYTHIKIQILKILAL